MKKRHEQKLVLLAISLFVLFNVPFVFMFEGYGHVFGIPSLYLGLFGIWALAIVVSYVVLKRHYE